MANISELESLRAIIANVKVYTRDAQKIAIVMKGDSLLRNNIPAYTSSQGAIDILLDIDSILAGKQIPSIEEIRKDIEEAEAKAKENAATAGTPYLY